MKNRVTIETAPEEESGECTGCCFLVGNGRCGVKSVASLFRMIGLKHCVDDHIIYKVVENETK